MTIGNPYQDSDEVIRSFLLFNFFLSPPPHSLFCFIFSLGFFNPPPPSGGKLLAGKDGGGPDGDVNQGRKSKRPRTLSSKLDGRFHFDKKTKLLVGHPSPFLSVGELASDPEVRYQRSLSKIKGKR